LNGGFVSLNSTSGDPASGAIGKSLAKKERRKIGLDVRHRRYCGTRTLDGRPTIYRNSCRHGLERLDWGTLMALEELPGVRRKAFDKSPLSFGVEGIETKGRLARTADSGNANEFIGSKIKGDLFEIVGAGAS